MGLSNMEVIKKELAEENGSIVEVWFTPINDRIMGFLGSLFKIALDNKKFYSLIPLIVVQRTMVYAEIYLSDDQPAFPMKQVAVTSEHPTGLTYALTETEYQAMWNLAPVIIRKNLFALALEANPAIEGLIEKYAKLGLELGRYPD